MNGGFYTKTNISIYGDCLTDMPVGLVNILIKLIDMPVELTGMPIELADIPIKVI